MMFVGFSVRDRRERASNGLEKEANCQSRPTLVVFIFFIIPLHTPSNPISDMVVSSFFSFFLYAATNDVVVFHVPSF